jgi:hypothetical protein
MSFYCTLSAERHSVLCRPCVAAHGSLVCVLYSLVVRVSGHVGHSYYEAFVCGLANMSGSYHRMDSYEEEGGML